MGDTDDAVPDYSAPEAFGALADPTRIDILRAIGEAEPRGAPSYLGFADLRERVGVRDSGRFSYHLEELRGTLVERNDDGEYGFTYAGYAIYRTLKRGLFESHERLTPVETSLGCPECGAGVSVSHRGDGMVDLECESCGADYVHYQFPPTGVDCRAADPDDLAMAVDAWARKQTSLFDRGVCPACGGPARVTLETDSAEVSDRMDEEAAYVRYVCRECGNHLTLTPGATLLEHPAVVSFFYDHGIDHRERPLFELLSDVSVRALDGESPGAAVEFPAEGETLVVRLGPDAAVADARRREEATA